MTGQTADWPWYARISLRARVTAVFALGMTAVICALGVVVHLRLGAVLLQGVDTGLRARADAFLAQLDGPALPPLRDDRLLDPDESFAQVLDRAGGVLISTSGVRSAPLLTPQEVRALGGAASFTRGVAGMDDPARLLAVPAVAGTRPVVVVVGATLGDRQDALDELVALYALAGPAALVLSSVVAWRVAGTALRPVERMTLRAAELAGTDGVRGRLPVPPTGDELTRLGVTLNAMLVAVEEAVARERRFIDHASHELRTPLAILKAEIDLASSRPRREEELHEVLGAVSRETDRLVRLAEDLLVLARTQANGLPCRAEEVSVPHVLREATDAFEGRARESGAAISLRVQPGVARVDPARLRQALDNMLDNALRHGTGPITVTGTRPDGCLRVEVADRGPGFPADLLPFVFEPFARAAAGPRAGGQVRGAGLGLAVVKAVATAHGGTAGAGNRFEGGARVWIDLPI